MRGPFGAEMFMLKRLNNYWLVIKSVFGLYRVGIYITDEALYFLEVDRDILSYRIRNIDVEWFLPDESLARPIERLVLRYPHIQNHPIYANVSEKSTISEFLKLPTMSSAELSSGLKNEVARYLPYNPQTMKLAYQRLGGRQEASWVLVVIAKNKQIQEVAEAFTEVGLHLLRLSISNYSFINAIKKGKSQTGAYLYPEPQSCTINLFSQGILIFSYTSHSKNLISQLNDIDQALQQYDKQNELSRLNTVLWFIGDLSSFPEDQKRRFYKYFTAIEQQREYVFPAKSVEKFFVELPAMVGLVVPRYIKINLLPDNVYKKIEGFLLRKRIFVGLVFFHLLLFFFGLQAYINHTIWELEENIWLKNHRNGAASVGKSFREGSLAALGNQSDSSKDGSLAESVDSYEDRSQLYEKRIDYMRQRIQKKKTLEQKYLKIQHYNNNRSIHSWLLHRFAQSSPKGVSFRRIEFDSDKGLYTIHGQARGHKDLAAMLQKLRQSEVMDNLQVLSVKQKKGKVFYEIQGQW